MCHGLMIGAIPFRPHLLHIRGTQIINKLYFYNMGHSYVSLRMIGHNSPSKLHPLYVKETHTDGCSTVENLYVSLSDQTEITAACILWIYS